MPRQPQAPPLDGALVINKPKGKTSHDVVDAVRHLAGFRQIGHLGTLDPLATGVLVLLLGRATRLVRFYAGRRKRYTAGFRFGFATDTYDSDGEALGTDNAPSLDATTLEKLASERVGRSVMPIAFWFFSIGGGLLLLAYALYIRDPVFIIGQGLGLFVYLRNLHFVCRERKAALVS